MGAGSISSWPPVYSHSTHAEQQQVGAGVRCWEHRVSNPDMVTDLWDCSLVSTWTLRKTLEQRPCMCEDRAMPRAVGTQSHHGVPRTPKEAKLWGIHSDAVVGKGKGVVGRGNSMCKGLGWV